MAVSDPCAICKKPVPAYKGHHPGERIARERRTCSKSCSVKLAHREGRWHLPKNGSGAKNTNWKGGMRQTKAGYRMKLAPPDHPYRTKRGYVMEHRLVVEAHIGRYLDPHEQVHHRNGIKSDNRLINLEIVTRANHYGQVTCPHCQTAFKIK